MLHRLPADSYHVCWGFFDHAVPPAIRIQSGDMVLVETVTPHAGDAADFMMDDAIRNLFQAIPFHERGPGPHIVTGPIYVEDAHPGDVLQVRILAGPWVLRWRMLAVSAQVVDQQLGVHVSIPKSSRISTHFE